MTASADPWTHAQIERDGLVLDVSLAGPQDGEPVLLLHGFPQDSRSWTPLARLLADDGLRLVAPDQRGYSSGARPSGVAAYGTDSLVDDALAVADAFGHRSVHLVGHDWGASVAWVLAARHPERVRSLLAISVPHLAAYGEALRTDADQQARSAYLGDFRRPAPGPEEALLGDDAARLRSFLSPGVSREDVEGYVELMRSGALSPALGWYRAMGPDLGALGPVAVDTTYVWSDGDPFLGRTGALACGAHVGGDYRFVTLPGVGHWIPDEAPEVLADELRRRLGVRPAR